MVNHYVCRGYGYKTHFLLTVKQHGLKPKDHDILYSSLTFTLSGDGDGDGEENLHSIPTETSCS